MKEKQKTMFAYFLKIKQNQQLYCDRTVTYFQKQKLIIGKKEMDVPYK